MQFLLADFFFVLSHCHGSKRRTIASRIRMAARDENRAREFRKGLQEMKSAMVKEVASVSRIYFLRVRDIYFDMEIHEPINYLS